MKADEIIAGRFVIESLAGSGGMGSVYRALDRETGAPVALKVLRGRGDRDLARFENEARVLAGLYHPGIVRYVAHGALADETPYLVMEWASGEDLGERLARAGLSVAESVELARSVANALSIAHAQGVVHRDVKPSNVMLTGDDRAPAKLLDFGIARTSQIRANTTLTRTGVLMGTPGYMAPEQARGDRDVDARADVFALGAVLFECLTGRPAFAGAHVIALLAKLLMEEPPRVDALRPAVPAALADLVARMLSKAREDRPRDAACVAAELDRLGPLEGTTAPSLPPRREALTGSEHRLLCVIVAAQAEFTGETAETGSSDALAEVEQRLSNEVRAMGARIERLAAGGFLVTVESAGSVADQAARAAQCALRIRLLLPALSIALVTGRSDTQERTPVGPILDRAGTLLAASVTPGSGVSVDAVTAGLLDLRFEIARTEQGLTLRGEREIGEEVRTLLGRPTPCVGRDRDLRTLLDLLEESATESVARVALVTAPAGAGKSRVRQEFVQRARRARPELAIWQGRGDALGAGSAFSLVGSALRHAAGILGGEPLPERRNKLLASVTRSMVEEERARVAMFLGEIAGAPFPDDASPKLRAARNNAEAMAEQLSRAFGAFLAAETAAHPLLLVLEDMHWGDLPSIKLMDGALRDLRDRPLVVVAFARPEVREVFKRLWEGREMQEIRLAELGPRAAASLVRHVLGSDTPAEQVASLVERAAGNPFYLEELIRAVAEGHGEALPDTVLGMVEARLLGFDPSARRVLRAASVFGGAFWGRGVLGMLGSEVGITLVQGTLGALVEREAILRSRQSRFPGEEEFTFRHALLREGAYAMLSEGDRVLAHKLAAIWLEQAGESDPMVLAEHFERGGDPARAIPFFERAAEQALRGRDIAAALDRAKRGLGAGAEDEARARLLTIVGGASIVMSDPSAALKAFDQAVSLAVPGSLTFCGAISGKLYAAFQLGQAQSLLEILAVLPGVTPDAESECAFVGAIGPLAHVLLGVGQIELAEAYIHRLETIGGPHADRDLLVRGWIELARAFRCYYRGDAWAASKLFESAARSFEEGGERLGVIVLGHAFRSNACYYLGAFAEGLRVAETIVAQNAPDNQAGAVGRILVANFRARLGEIDEAVKVLLAELDDASARGVPFLVRPILQSLALIELRRGDLDAAVRHATAAVELLAQSPWELIAVLAILADARRQQGRLDEARAAIDRGRAVQRALPPPNAFSAHLGLVQAEVLLASGDPLGAAEMVAAGRAELLARAERIDEPAIRRSFLEAIPEHARLLSLGG